MNKLIPSNIYQILYRIHNKDYLLTTLTRYIESKHKDLKVERNNQGLTLLQKIDYEYRPYMYIKLIKNDRDTYDIIEEYNEDLIEYGHLLGHCCR